MNKRWYLQGLSAQLFKSVLLSLLAAIIVFIPCLSLGNQLLAKTVYGRPFMAQMADEQFAKLQEYVAQRQVTMENLHLLNAWCSRGDKVYLTVYLHGRILYESPQAANVEPNPEDFNVSFEDEEQEYALTLSDGTAVQVFLYYYAGDAFYYWVLAASGLLAFTVFSVCFIGLVNHKLRYIKRLKRELDILAGGDLHYPVTVKGQDELAELAFGIDQMRCSILTHQKAEEQIRSANSQLVTAMSHDLRTPLTSLLAYLELLERGKYSDEAQLRHFISRSLENTLRIKNMADKLFEYFLVYSTEWEQPDLEPVAADELLQQFWGEYAFALENNGFKVASDFRQLDCRLNVNIEMLRRAFDNLYANILKYAEPAQPVKIYWWKDDKQVCLLLSNHIANTRNVKESTNIGLKTCQRIIQEHNGSFNYKIQDKQFQVKITLPFI